ncbi:MAG: hypothetical protein WCJ40_16505 [Planctomycetota bacterium]
MESLTIDDQMLLWEVIAQKAIQKVEEDANQNFASNGLSFGWNLSIAETNRFNYGVKDIEAFNSGVVDVVQIIGQNKLEGEIRLEGAKNAVTKQMIASILTNEPVFLTNVSLLLHFSNSYKSNTLDLVL